MKFKRFIYKLTYTTRKLRQIFYKFFNPLFFRLAGIKFGSNLKVVNRVYLNIHESSKVEIGDNFTIFSGDNFNPLSRNIRTSIYVADNAKLKIGSNSGISSACIWVSENITIGNYVKIGANCSIIDTDAHCLDWKIRMTEFDHENAISKPIVICDNVLIGTGCYILKGVSIGEHSVIGAGSVVSKSIPANCIAAGNPAKVIKYFEK